MQPSRASKGLWLRRDFLGEQTRREHQTVGLRGHRKTYGFVGLTGLPKAPVSRQPGQSDE